MTTTNITGRLAITVAEMCHTSLRRHAGPSEDAAFLSPAEARRICGEDPSLVYVNSADVAAAISDERIQDLAIEADAADDTKQLRICAVALGHEPGDRVAARVACARVIAEARGRR